MILVTGGAGYVGSHAVKRFLQSGYDVLVLDDLSQGHREALLSPHFVQMDVTHADGLRALFRQYPIESVVHFAARALVGESGLYPDIYFRQNMVGTMTLLDAMREAGVSTFVFSSTCATYGNPISLPIEENHPQNPLNPYGESKRMVERLLHYYGEAYGIRSVSLRYFNACGADPDGQLGERHHPETHLIPLVLQVALGKRETISIYGSDYPTPDGTCIRDYVHVNDLAYAHLLALQYLQNPYHKSTALNVGTGTGHSVMQVIEACRDITGHDIPVHLAERRPGDAPILVAKVDRVQEVLGWTAAYRELKSIIRTTWEFERTHPWG